MPRRAAGFARPLRIAAAAALAAATGLAPAGFGQSGPGGDELQVNTYTSGSQNGPAVAVDAAGDFVVVWSSLGSDGTDTDGASVQGRRFFADDAPPGAQFQVNAATAGHQHGPAVAAGAAGEFVVAFRSYYCVSPYTCYFDFTAARRFAADGVPLGDDFPVSNLAGATAPPAVAKARAGGFVVVWSSATSAGGDLSGASVQARRYDAQGQPVGSQFQVNTHTTGSQFDPAAAVDAAGNFVVVWTTTESSGPDSWWSLRAQRFDAEGVAQGPEFQVNAYAPQMQRDPTVAMAPGGSFVVAWQSNRATVPEAYGYSIQARRFAADGTPLGGDFLVNDYTTGAQASPRIAIDELGDFLVVWDSEGSWANDADETSIQARWFDAAGNPQGGQFQVNTYTTGAQRRASVAVRDRDNFVVAWVSDGSAGTDTDGSSVQARRYGVPFADGFETGDTGRWSDATP